MYMGSCVFQAPWRPTSVLDDSYHVRTHWALILEYSVTVLFSHICNVYDYICFQHLAMTKLTSVFHIWQQKTKRLKLPKRVKQQASNNWKKTMISELVWKRCCILFSWFMNNPYNVSFGFLEVVACWRSFYLLILC